VTIGSVDQVRPHAQMMIYAGTEAAQLNRVWNLARQFGGQGVTVNNLAPVPILTAWNRAQMATEGAALVLCSEAGSCINGVNCFVDGGRALAWGRSWPTRMTATLAREEVPGP
jgi:NAD(P)-dependent dehydrogenase (short-subunit alcohol dehydrogenase family)